MRKIYFLIAVLMLLSAKDLLAQGGPPEPCDDGSTPTRVYPDKDGDFFGTLQGAKFVCGPVPNGYVVNFLDCDDNNASINPNATEICDGIDNNCNDQVDEVVVTRLYVKWNALGNGNGLSWTNAYTKLQDALARANICANVVEIWLAEGTYYPDETKFTNTNDAAQSFHLKNNLAIYGGFAGNETLLSQRNWNDHVTILSGEIQQNNIISDNSSNVVKSDGHNNTAILDGFKIVEGNAASSGGGLYITSSSPSIINCTFSNNRGNNGGGMANLNSSSPKITNCVFTGNYTYQNDGGAMYNQSSSPIITNCCFLENASNSEGGGIYNTFCPSVTIVNSTFWKNTAGEGGGVYNGNSSVAITNCTFSKNTATGGGLYNSSSVVPITNCILWGNSTNQFQNAGSGDVDINYCIISVSGLLGTGNINKDPMFLDPNNGDLHIPSCSPAIDKGNNASISETTDLDGNSRKYNATNLALATVDIGAYEFIGNATAELISYKDADNDGYSNGTVAFCEKPAGYKLASELTALSGDCNDDNDNVYPGATEICDELDNDCDGETDEGVKTIFYFDNDHDGLGDPNNSIEGCERPAGYVTNDDDNDDNCAGYTFTGVYPDFDGDGYGNPNASGEHTVPYCDNPMLPGLFVYNNLDCNDNNPNVKPGAIEICDDMDNDCDGSVDEGFVRSFWYRDLDGDGYGDPNHQYAPYPTCDQPAGYVNNLYDCNDTYYHGSNFIVYVDVDGDGYHGYSYTVCTGINTESTTLGLDCNDADGTIHPGAVEICDGKDNDCDGVVDPVTDQIPPTFTGSYADDNLGCNPSNPDGSLGTATATDASGTVTITSQDGSVVSDGCNRSKTRTFTATDGCNNTASTSRTVTWIVDVTPPVFTGSYADIDLGCNPGNPVAALGTATATDACGEVTITHADSGGGSGACNFSRIRVFTARDGCGNTATVSRTVLFKADHTDPSFTGDYSDVNLGCNPTSDPTASLGTAIANDECGTVDIWIEDGDIVSDGCNRSITRTFEATDRCRHWSTISRTVRWVVDDATPPSFAGSYVDVNLGCNPADPNGSLGSATAIDGCGAVTITSQDGSVYSSGCNRSRTRTFTVTDGCLNTSTISRTIRWIADATPPSFTGSYADVNLGCNPTNPDGSLGTATATDVCGAVTITSSDGAVVSDGCNRSRTRTFTATDGCLNTSTTSRTVRWIADLTPPSFTGSYADVNLGCNPANTDGSLGTATATDVCGAVTITSSDGAVVSTGCNRSRTRTFTATDGCLNTSTTSRTVRWIADITPPSFTGYYSDVNLNCNPANPDGSLGTATATDGCGAVTITSSDGAVVSNGCNRSRTRTFTATDGCLNTSTTSRTVRWIHDLTAPTLVCAKTGTVTKSTNAGLCTYAVYGNEFNPTASDVCSTPSLAWSVSGETTVSGNTTMAGVLLNFGNNTIKWTATDACGNTSTCSFIVHVNKVTTTTSLVVSTTPASNPVTQQYSDKITCVATVTNCPNAGPIGGTVTFKIINAQGTVVLGSAPVASDGTATLTAALLENQFYPGATNLLPSNGPLKPGSKAVTAEYSDTDPDYIVTNPPAAPLVVTCEDADITYNGLNYFGANPNTKEGTITVSAFVLDANDVPAQARGDIRNATVTFKETTSGGAAIGTSNIPVGLVNPTNFQEGIVTTNKTYTLTTQEISYGGKIVDVWAGVNNYYCGEVAEVVPVCISLPGGDFVTGGGWIKMLNSEGSYAGTDDKKMHAALVFKWNKSNKNLQGNATIIYKLVVNGVQKVYQVKSNSITSMIVNNVNDAGTAVTTGATYRMAQIVTKANFRDLTDPDFPLTLFGNLTLTITAWESIAVTDGSKDRISVQLVGSGSQGLLFSSNWLSGATQWQQIGGGKMRVRNPSAEIPCTNCSGSGITAKPGEVDKTNETIPVTEDLKVTVMPNPSSTNFRIVVNSSDLKAPVKLLITDMLGKVIETRITNAGQLITIGDRYISGTYAVRILQGRKTRQLTLIKLSD